MITPLRNLIVIKPVTEDEKTDTGIIIPNASDKKAPDQGRVVARGPEATEVKVNDKVFFSKYAAIEIKDGDKELLMVTQNDILAKLEK